MELLYIQKRLDYAIQGVLSIIRIVKNYRIFASSPLIRTIYFKSLQLKLLINIFLKIIV